ncbi:hypothetical protein N865_21830 [Intrasporangium oryzae NRRL B-24470]|uniref:Uncharacterized protein n=1 Tax=Intrasporangium oryzae NRRL B-24470 TaxID=1386089 RepID=W9G2W3_9MICO|nr:hypothetical protein [Intrasporangium oryzae]EWS99621.1 hypothetical protein N865_21830 [Intrasporangium oryzae NRRL B-24470]
MGTSRNPGLASVGPARAGTPEGNEDVEDVLHGNRTQRDVGEGGEHGVRERESPPSGIRAVTTRQGVGAPGGKEPAGDVGQEVEAVDRDVDGDEAEPQRDGAVR